MHWDTVSCAVSKTKNIRYNGLLIITMILQIVDIAWEKPTATGREKQTEPPPVREGVRVPHVSRVSNCAPDTISK